MATCAICGEDIATENLHFSEDALLMLRIADHMLQLWGRPQQGPISRSSAVLLGGDFPRWFTFAHLGRVQSKIEHMVAHGGWDTEPFKTNEWLTVAKQYCLVGLDRTTSGQELRDEILDPFVPQDDAMLAAQMAEGNVKIDEEYFSRRGGGSRP
jgi:hypothetical protein